MSETRLTKDGKRPEWRHKTIEQHIHDSVFPCAITGCWWWAGGVARNGYGAVSIDHKSVRAHRAIYEHYTGRKLTPDIFLRHTCDNKLCVNPSHLFEGDAKANADDLVSKNLQLKGSKNGGAKLKEEQVIEIKKKLKLGQRQCDLANEYGVHYSTIHLISKGKKWGWLNV